MKSIYVSDAELFDRDGSPLVPVFAPDHFDAACDAAEPGDVIWMCGHVDIQTQ